MNEHQPLLPGHEQAASFRVGATIATQAIAVCIDAECSGGPYPVPCEFDRLPVRLRVSILAACEEEFRRRKEALLGADARQLGHGESRP